MIVKGLIQTPNAKGDKIEGYDLNEIIEELHLKKEPVHGIDFEIIEPNISHLIKPEYKWDMDQLETLINLTESFDIDIVEVGINEFQEDIEELEIWLDEIIISDSYQELMEMMDSELEKLPEIYKEHIDYKTMAEETLYGRTEKLPDERVIYIPAY